MNKLQRLSIESKIGGINRNLVHSPYVLQFNGENNLIAVRMHLADSDVAIKLLSYANYKETMAFLRGIEAGLELVSQNRTTQVRMVCSNGLSAQE